MAETPGSNPVVAAIGTIFDQIDIAEAVRETIQVPFSMVGLIIGRKGENLRHLQEMFSVQLRVSVRSGSDVGATRQRGDGRQHHA